MAAQQQEVAIGFNAATRRFLRRQPALAFQSGGTTNFDLPQVGFLGGIILQLRGTTTTAAASSATVEDYPNGAHGLMNRIKLTTNEGADIFNLSGQGAYLMNRVQRTAFDPFSAFPSQSIAGVADSFPRYQTNPVSLGASASQEWVSTLWFPVAWTLANLQGMLLAQNLGVRFTLSIDWGTITNLYSATTGTVTLSNVTATPQLVMFAIPDSEVNYPDLRFTHNWVEETPPLNTLAYTFRPKLGNIYLRIIEEFINPVSSNNLPIAPSNFGFRDFSYAQVQNVENTISDIDLFWQRMNYSADLPPGVYVREWQNGNGIIELGNTRDAVDSAQITDMLLSTQLASTLTLNTGAFVRTVQEQLVETRG